MKKILGTIIVFAWASSGMQAQFLNRLGNAARNAAENAAERAVERNVEKKVDNAIDNAFENDNQVRKEEQVEKQTEKPQNKQAKTSGWTCTCGATGNTGKFCSECGAKQPVASDGTWTCSCGHKGNTGKFCAECGAKQAASENADNAQSASAIAPEKTLEMTYAKSDFVAGDEIIFDDDVSGEQIGEFPSKWNLERGNAEVAMVNGEKVICLIGNDSWISPLMKEPKSYLSDVFTLEFDIMCPQNHADGSFELDFMQPNAGRDHDTYTVTWSWYYYEVPLNYEWVNTNDERNRGAGPEYIFPDGKWHHIALSFNKRALKIYRDGKRVGNVPNVKAGAGWVTWWTGHGTEGKDKYMKNVRIAKGAVPLYDRMMSDGKFITYGITFDVGKSTIKPESMGEINRIVTMMNEKPELKFSVEGHTDNTGNAASNQTLSEARSKAIVDKLVEMGISADRLTSSGKGQTSPIADNGTDEGRAKNRRVEFVKL